MRYRATITTPAVALLLVVLVGCGMDDDGAAPVNGGEEATPATDESVVPDESVAAGETEAATGDTTVALEGLAFGQDQVTVPAGTTVTWENQDSVGHTVTHGEDGQPAADAAFDMAVAPGESVTYTFDEPGEYPITCTIHPAMNMTVVVEE